MQKFKTIKKCKSIQADKHKCANSFRYFACTQYDNLNSSLLTSDSKPIILPLICERKQVNQFPSLTSGYKAISKKEGMSGYHFWIPIKQEGNRWVVKCYANVEDRFSGEAFGSEDITNAVAGRLMG